MRRMKTVRLPVEVIEELHKIQREYTRTRGRRISVSKALDIWAKRGVV